MWLQLGGVGAALGGGGLDPLPAAAVLAAAVVTCLALELGLHHRHEGRVEGASSAEAFVP